MCCFSCIESKFYLYNINILFKSVIGFSPFSKIKSLKELCHDLGTNFMEDLNVDKHTNYESYDAVHEMERAMASVIKKRI